MVASSQAAHLTGGGFMRVWVTMAEQRSLVHGTDIYTHTFSGHLGPFCTTVECYSGLYCVVQATNNHCCCTSGHNGHKGERWFTCELCATMGGGRSTCELKKYTRTLSCGRQHCTDCQLYCEASKQRHRCQFDFQFPKPAKQQLR